MSPIQRSDYLKPLSRDHHYSLLFGWKLKQGINHGVALPRMTRYVAYFWPRMLMPHFREEEQTLFCYSHEAETQQAIQEHRHIEALMEKIIRAPEETSYEALRTLAETVDLHVRFEERTLFPFLEASLTPQALAAAGEKIAAAVPVSDDYDDHFWELVG